ncbi:alpha/beta hydrolase [Verrucomicrobiaceae bacterium N1E253]|uniref:Alpha/beta hydrolase n=1 Tax=Oceaniferula marina TaxID=2748318 RepID=A0A851GAB1_9BACT|nr:alpha/beta fold hydrolase [Oceaniferula marina]NWK54553.1 alpha/beta hydrolase [Oceaniferula marina]
MDPTLPTWTFLPGLHGTGDLYSSVRAHLPEGINAEFINLPRSGKQTYPALASWLDGSLAKGQARLWIAESFSGPLALRMAALRPEESSGVVLAASFCDTPLNPGYAMLPLRPLFMVSPPRHALKHYLIGDDASAAELAELRSVIRQIPSGTLAKRVRSVLSLDESDNPDLSDTPMLILQAQSDNLVPWEAQSRLLTSYPKASVHWIESPHLVFQREPRQCVKHILQFLQET